MQEIIEVNRRGSEQRATGFGSSVARAGRKETVVSVLLSTLGARSFPNYDRSATEMSNGAAV